VPPERPAVPEVCSRRCRRRRRRRPVPRRRCGHGRYLDVVLAAPRTLNVQLKVEDREADRLSRLDADSPPALGVHVILVGIVGTGQVATAVELDGWCLAAGGRQRRAPAVDRLNYISTRYDSSCLRSSMMTGNAFSYAEVCGNYCCSHSRGIIPIPIPFPFPVQYLIPILIFPTSLFQFPPIPTVVFLSLLIQQ